MLTKLQQLNEEILPSLDEQEWNEEFADPTLGQLMGTSMRDRMRSREPDISGEGGDDYIIADSGSSNVYGDLNRADEWEVDPERLLRFADTGDALDLDYLRFELDPQTAREMLQSGVLLSGDPAPGNTTFKPRIIVTDNGLEHIYGDDVILAEGARNDVFSSTGIWGSYGNDWIRGSSGNDRLTGGPVQGDFRYVKALNNILVDPIQDRDHLFGMDGDDILIGGYENDVLVGGAGQDILIGSSRKRGQHAFDGIDEVWGDDEGGNGLAGADRFILGEDGDLYYDDGVDVSRGRSNYAYIRDFSRVDKLQLLEYQPRSVTVETVVNGVRQPYTYRQVQSIYVAQRTTRDLVRTGATFQEVEQFFQNNPNANSGVAIWYHIGLSGNFSEELIAFVEGPAADSLLVAQPTPIGLTTVTALVVVKLSLSSAEAF